MFENQIFVKSVHHLNDLPKTNLPEVILCGRSNVGKSSFINSLFNRKELAKISSTPGKTRSINYYLIDEKFYMVDLPGYGYAKASLKDREIWGKLINDFIYSSKNIRFAFHIIDCRHKPTDLDLQMNSLLVNSNIPFTIILNKSDKLRQSEFNSAKKNALEELKKSECNGGIILFSANKSTGKSEVLKTLAAIFYNK
jgi:GTP-binding protein